MLTRIITGEIAEFMVWLTELTSIEFYGNNSPLAYKSLFEKEIWHHFIENYEKKRDLKPEALMDEVREMLKAEKTPLSNSMLLSDVNTAPVRKIVRGLADRYNWNYSIALDRFYTSEVAGMLFSANIKLASFPIAGVFEFFDKRFKQEKSPEASAE